MASIAPAYTSSPQGIGSPQLVWYAVWYGQLMSAFGLHIKQFCSLAYLELALTAWQAEMCVKLFPALTCRQAAAFTHP